MAKVKTVYECSSCGYQLAKWAGKCPSCNAWNSFVESKREERKQKQSIQSSEESYILDEIKNENIERICSAIVEFDRVLGGGIVAGSVIVVGGAPGIGKSTLLLQILHRITKQEKRALYFSGEESATQIKMRADRLKIKSSTIQISTQIEIDGILRSIKKENPNLVVIDSIQTIYNQELESVPGSLAQLRDCTFQLVKAAKSWDIPIIIIGHVTKDGQIAGPKILEHMVDVVLYFEGDLYTDLRILRTYKNRFGATNEIGLFQMEAEGLVESSIPAHFSSANQNESGIALSCVKEGTQFMIVEVQALVTRANFGVAQRVTNAYDHKRVAVILAVLEKKAGLFLGDQDVFVKISGSIKVKDPTVEMAIAIAIWSSFSNRIVMKDSVFLGELSLSGRFQSVSQLADRRKDLEKFAVKQSIVSEENNCEEGNPSIRFLQGISDLEDYLI